MPKAPIQYDAEVIQQFAARLYKRAASIVFAYSFLGFLLGIVGGGAAATSVAGSGGGMIFLVIGAALGLLIGFMLGQEKAFALKLEAQVALCQCQIERNTSAGAS